MILFCMILCFEFLCPIVHGDRMCHSFPGRMNEETSLEPVDLRELLEQVRGGGLDIEEPHCGASGQAPRSRTLALPMSICSAWQQLRLFPEVIFCQGKTGEWIAGVVRKLIEAGQHCLATRVSDEHAVYLQNQFPTAQQDRVARTFWLPAGPLEPLSGHVVIITAGTSDLPVAQEALVTAQALGCHTRLIADVGVAGIHRLLRHRQDFAGADAIVVTAGMDGALPSVVGGLVDCPVIAVPTSVGYGAAFSGLAPLLTMLNACSANVVVVNIDSGFKGGYVAALIARRAAKEVRA